MANTLINKLDNAFWQFSLRIYRHESIKTACLSFQNQEEINVNLLLLCCWLSYSVQKISPLEFQQACDLIDEWQQKITQPLRQVRQYLKTRQGEDWINRFYEQILADELVSESYQQHSLFSCFADKQKSQQALDEALMFNYITQLFESKNKSISNELHLKIDHFIKATIQVLKKEQHHDQ